MDIAEDYELKLFAELYEESIIKGNEGLENLKNKAKKYDINPDLNYAIMKKILNKKNMNKNDINSFYDFYRNYIQTLFYDQKKDIIDEINKTKNKKLKEKITKIFKLNKKSFVDSYFDIMKKLYDTANKSDLNNKIDYDKILDLFLKDYYVDNYEINIPLIYGTNELIFAGLINNLYHRFFIDKKIEEIDIEDIDTLTGFANYPKLIIKKIRSTNEDDSSDSSKYIDINIEEELPQEKIKINPNKFNSKLEFIKPFLKKIISKDFKEIFNLMKIKEENSSNAYKVKPKMNSLVFHLLFFELIFHIYNIYNDEQYISKFNHRFFFETREEKIIFFNEMNEIENEIIIVNEKGEKIKETKDIENKLYDIYNAKNLKEKIKFNPFDYILSEISDVKNFKDLKKKLESIEYFSLNKFYQENRLFENNKIDSLFKNNIREMLSSEAISELFSQYANFNDYNCPYSGDKEDGFIKQTFDIIFYFPIPFKKISGFTYKKFGLIFISNNNRFEKILKSNVQKIENEQFFQIINKMSFFKVVHIHEIISHYSCTIIHSNNNNIPINTPPNTLMDYEPMEKYSEIALNHDGGDKGECIMFGNKIKYIYTNGALYIINNNNYNNNLKEFRNEFIKKNIFKKGDIFDFSVESEKNQLIKEFIRQFFGTKNNQKSIKLNKYNISSFRIIENSKGNMDVENELFSQGITYFERVPHIFTSYRKMA